MVHIILFSFFSFFPCQKEDIFLHEVCRYLRARLGASKVEKICFLGSTSHVCTKFLCGEGCQRVAFKPEQGAAAQAAFAAKQTAVVAGNVP